MSTTDAPPRSPTFVEWLRWLCVLPAAFLIRFAAQLALGLATRGAGEELVRRFVVYSASEAIFVVIGASVAPRRQSTVAIVLAVLGAVLSLLKHVVVQYAAGNRVRSTNYIDFALDGFGLACGAALVIAAGRRKAQSSAAEIGNR